MLRSIRRDKAIRLSSGSVGPRLRIRVNRNSKTNYFQSLRWDKKINTKGRCKHLAVCCPQVRGGVSVSAFLSSSRCDFPALQTVDWPSGFVFNIILLSSAASLLQRPATALTRRVVRMLIMLGFFLEINAFSQEK